MNKFKITPIFVNKNTKANTYFDEISTTSKKITGFTTLEAATSPNVNYKTYITEKLRAPAFPIVLLPSIQLSAGTSLHQ